MQANWPTSFVTDAVVAGGAYQSHPKTEAMCRMHIFDTSPFDANVEGVAKSGQDTTVGSRPQNE